jgi:predicted nuclease of predicted toxin-antitoxin system
VNFLVDNQLPPSLSAFLNARCHQASHVFDLQMDELPDVDIWNYAVKTNSVVVSKDEDFLHLANRPGNTGRLLWVRIGNCRKPALLRTFEHGLADAVRAFESGSHIVEIR